MTLNTFWHPDLEFVELEIRDVEVMIDGSPVTKEMLFTKDGKALSGQIIDNAHIYYARNNAPAQKTLRTGFLVDNERVTHAGFLKLGKVADEG